MRTRGRLRRWVLTALLGLTAMGCGTTRMTDTQRTATEQLLISSAVDQAVSQLDFRQLAGKPVFLDAHYLDGTVDRAYLISSLRQHLLATGCILQEDRAKATYVVEARAGAVGTERHSLLVGIPQTTLPALMPGQPTQIPEIPFAKKTDQSGIAKIAVFAFNRETGQPVWQSGVVQAVSTAKDLWLLGAGPFENGSIHERAKFAGQPLPPLPLPSFGGGKDEGKIPDLIPVTQAASWTEPVTLTADGVSSLGMLTSMQAGLLIPPGPWVRTRLLVQTANPAEPAKPKGGSSAAPPPRLPFTPSAPNLGGQAETQPAQMLNWGLSDTPRG